MQLPPALLQSLDGVKGFDKKTFEEVHASGEQVTSIRINPSKKTNIQFPNSPIPWSEYGFYLDERPSFTFDPLFHAGCYYVQEASSMFLEQALKQTVDLTAPLKVLDLCAAPGGKSTHIQSLINQESLLVSNEVIRSRVHVLRDNIVKWGSSNVVVTNNDPKDFARLENYFDVIVVDAPCSGSGLFRRDPDAIEEWSENNVQLCTQRQQRILADVFPALEKNGVLIYSTCSYSKEEDEEILDWITRTQLTVGNEQLIMDSCKLKIENGWGITETITENGNTGYRFWPDKIKGEGFFIAAFRKKSGEEDSVVKSKNRTEHLTKKEIAVISPWSRTEGFEFVKHLNTVYAWPAHLADEMNRLLSNLHVIYSGTIIGELMRDKLVPDHALAMSKLVEEKMLKYELTIDQAIAYLQRKPLDFLPDTKGWQLVTYKNYVSGWINVLPNRINNYYPKELRIIKDN
ncbi:MAG: Fmu (Sun) domain protein [Bacteroidetes bacterium]|nr:Fmu (Sun) domain protein [Bacteroidota bacterium]